MVNLFLFDFSYLLLDLFKFVCMSFLPNSCSNNLVDPIFSPCRQRLNRSFWVGPAKIRHLGRITPNLEAMAYIIIQNNYKKWPCFWKIKAEHTDEQVRIVQQKKPDHQDLAGNHTVDMVEYPDLSTKWTEIGKGQKKFGGWPEEAIKEHAKLRKEAAGRRKRAATATLEKAILVKVRHSNTTITGDNYEQYRASKGSKPAVKPKTTGIDIADYDLFGLEESGLVVTYSDDSAEEEGKADDDGDKDDDDDDASDDGSGGDPPKKDDEEVEETGENV